MPKNNERAPKYFPVPGMFGTFAELSRSDDTGTFVWKLKIVESYGQKYEITEKTGMRSFLLLVCCWRTRAKAQHQCRRL
jgi:hypothetical protein